MKGLLPFILRFRSWYSLHGPAEHEGWQQRQLLSLFALALFLLVSLAWTDPVSGWSVDSGSSARSAAIVNLTTTPVPYRSDETVTPLPPEMLNNLNQTNGVILFGVVIVLIIVTGAIGVERSRRTE
jgi:hypothetical protein